MRKTVRIQANKNATSKQRDEKPGLIYYRRDRKRPAPRRLRTPLRRGFSLSALSLGIMRSVN